ncbi:hypothetical protein CAEBREN_20339 [Caenorhabditis brenneri]|uniref:Uncharacterized protein n=1 Tax=Caenorhabditis brenneri TaxID=135651 RepID=G0MBF9_CAEBE|nr:hypothetical protein CAEBREN_20339 [Caenorhabditis brenneri]
MVKIHNYDPLPARIVAFQPLPTDPDFVPEQPAQEDPMEDDGPSGLCFVPYYIVQAFIFFGESCVAICGCEEMDADY